eukprot:1114005-Pyramimonas_sp.AAC.2
MLTVLRARWWATDCPPDEAGGEDREEPRGAHRATELLQLRGQGPRQGSGRRAAGGGGGGGAAAPHQGAHRPDGGPPLQGIIESWCLFLASLNTLL